MIFLQIRAGWCNTHGKYFFVLSEVRENNQLFYLSRDLFSLVFSARHRNAGEIRATDRRFAPFGRHCRRFFLIFGPDRQNVNNSSYFFLQLENPKIDTANWTLDRRSDENRQVFKSFIVATYKFFGCPIRSQVLSDFRSCR